MKKITYFTLMMLFSVIAISMSSCSKGSSDDTPQVSFSYLSVSYKFTSTGDLFKVFDVTAQYKDATGKVVSEAVTADFSKAFKVTSLPYTSGLKITFKLKDNLDTTAKYNITTSLTPDYAAYTSDGKEQGFAVSTEQISKLGVPYSTLATLATSMNNQYMLASTFALSGSVITMTKATIDF